MGIYSAVVIELPKITLGFLSGYLEGFKKYIAMLLSSIFIIFSIFAASSNLVSKMSYIDNKLVISSLTESMLKSSMKTQELAISKGWINNSKKLGEANERLLNEYKNSQDTTLNFIQTISELTKVKTKTLILVFSIFFITIVELSLIFFVYVVGSLLSKPKEDKHTNIVKTIEDKKEQQELPKKEVNIADYNLNIININFTSLYNLRFFKNIDGNIVTSINSKLATIDKSTVSIPKEDEVWASRVILFKNNIYTVLPIHKI